jgi:hypothetical protein
MEIHKLLADADETPSLASFNGISGYWLDNKWLQLTSTTHKA